MGIKGWTRIGIVLSVIWIVGAGFHARGLQVEIATDLAGYARDDCYAKKRSSNDCREAWDRAFVAHLGDGWDRVAVSAFAPVVLGWLGFCIVLVAGRWVLRGFAPLRK
jgi:hypothetical protein